MTGASKIGAMRRDSFSRALLIRHDGSALVKTFNRAPQRNGWPRLAAIKKRKVENTHSSKLGAGHSPPSAYWGIGNTARGSVCDACLSPPHCKSNSHASFSAGRRGRPRLTGRRPPLSFPSSSWFRKSQRYLEATMTDPFPLDTTSDGRPDCVR